MIEYYAHVAGVDATQRSISVVAGDIAELADRANQLVSAIEDHRPLAWLGSIIDALVGHAGSDAEIALLRKCADAWGRALALYEEIGTARIEFELALLRDDIENPVEVAQMGFDRLVRTQATANTMLAELKALQADVAAAPHLPPHPRQSDKPSSEWSTGDAFLGRRSLAFAAAMFTHAQDARGLALAAGALAGFAGNVAGSAYLGHTVGGPRRLQRFRDRLARNTLGAWVHTEKATPAVGSIAGGLREAAADSADHESLAPDLAAQIAAALVDAFPARAAIDVQIGYRRVIEHLELLGQFRLPNLPESPPIVQPADGGVMAIETGSQGGDIKPLDAGQGGQPFGPLDPIPPSPGDPQQDKSSNSKGGCGALALLAALIVAVLVYGIWCIVRLADDKDCDPGDLVDDLVGEDGTVEAEVEVDQTKLTVLRKPERASHLLQDIYKAQLNLWQTFEAARRALIINGLIYPATEDLAQKLHQQFLVAFATGNDWPHLGSDATDAAFQAYPLTPAEEPNMPSPFPNAGPGLLFEAELQSPTIAAVARDAFLAIVDPAGPETHANLDLDTDRGWLHPCWAVSDGGSIGDVPLAVSIIPFASE